LELVKELPQQRTLIALNRNPLYGSYDVDHMMWIYDMNI